MLDVTIFERKLSRISPIQAKCLVSLNISINAPPLIVTQVYHATYGYTMYFNFPLRSSVFLTIQK
jgi:hypothetical protein